MYQHRINLVTYTASRNKFSKLTCIALSLSKFQSSQRKRPHRNDSTKLYSRIYFEFNSHLLEEILSRAY